MGFYEEFARKYFEQALRDLERAKRSYREKDYPETVFHAQQCVEKAVKAMIEAKREYVYNHDPRLSSIFIRVFEREWRNEYDEIVDILGWFTEYYSRSRYPFLLRGHVVSPDEYIDREIANEAIIKAEKVVKIVQEYLVERKIL
ncbi:MAG: hypothetical protein B6U89_05930 [Desulfurococcales archaeon ex4484_58]|nr:MAG: hypothetical protein B6U89_05930 [Desulfurococcales archaeon ex4484_58]